MKVLVIGNGGREHALCTKISQSPKLQKLYCSPGNKAFEDIAQSVEITDFEELARWAKSEQIDLTVVGPEAPLSAGIVDVFKAHGLRIFGPNKEAAMLEASKAFSKEVMMSAGVSAAKSEVFTDAARAIEYVKRQSYPIVLKADGLCAGKGVVIAHNEEEAVSTINDFIEGNKYGDASSRVLIEDFIEGKEASLIGIVSSGEVLPFVCSQDYKRLLDGDEGPNTGGMGAISPTTVISDSEVDKYAKEIFKPVADELSKRGIDYCGFLYAGLMLDSKSSKVYVLEFNCRMGDPETQVILPRLEDDLLEILDKAEAGKLSELSPNWSKYACACVVLSSEGYPQNPRKGDEIEGLDDLEDDTRVYFAGVKKDETGRLLTNGGRVMAVTKKGPSFNDALEGIYKEIPKIHFNGMHFRRDIGKNS